MLVAASNGGVSVLGIESGEWKVTFSTRSWEDINQDIQDGNHMAQVSSCYLFLNDVRMHADLFIFQLRLGVASVIELATYYGNIVAFVW